MIVLKFGGTSVGSLERVREAAAIAAAQPAPRAVVVSAASGVTNLLLEAGRQAASGDRGGMASTVQAIVEKHTAILEGLPESADRKDTEIRVGDLHTALELTLADVALAGELTAKNSDRIVSTGEKVDEPADGRDPARPAAVPPRRSLPTASSAPTPATARRGPIASAPASRRTPSCGRCWTKARPW